MHILILLLKQISCALFGNKTLIMQRDITNVLTFSFKGPVILLKSYGNLNCVNRISKNTKFYENPSRGNRDVPCGRTDRHDEANNRFSQFCERV
jgi:hypothetical protein